MFYKEVVSIESFKNYLVIVGHLTSLTELLDSTAAPDDLVLFVSGNGLC